jgi:hypothetical protein
MGFSIGSLAIDHIRSIGTTERAPKRHKEPAAIDLLLHGPKASILPKLATFQRPDKQTGGEEQ